MNRKYPMIVAAVAAAVASGYAGAAVPTLAQANAPAASLVIAGSSAAQAGVTQAITNDLCGGAANTLNLKSSGGSGNFLATSCFTAIAIPNLAANTLVTVYYRTEGGSVVGALPIVTNKQIKRLNIAGCTTSGGTNTCTVNGVTSQTGTTDAWTGAVVADTVQLGVTDVEPALLIANDFPSNYSAAAFGTATPAQMKALPTVRLYDQVFGLVVNKSGQTFSQVNLSRESAANIILGNYQAPQPGSKGHYHEEGSEFWLIMLGKIRYNIEGLQEFEAEEGDVVYVPRQTWHLASFGGQEGLRSCRLAMNGFPYQAHMFEQD